MDSLIAIGIGSFIVTFSGAASPGPVLTITLAESAKRGFKVGPLIVLGHAILEIPVVIAVAVGFAQFLKQPLVVKTIGFIGGIVLLWLSWLTYLESKKVFSLEVGNTGISCWWDLPVKGILTSLSNPYWFLWWATIGLAYLTISMKAGLWGVVVFYFAHILADFVWYSFVSFMMASSKRFISGRIYKGLLITCSIFLAVFAIYFFYTALST